MSKNSAKQRVECFQNWLHFIESKRKTNRQPNKTKNKTVIKYHPSLEYNGE